MRGTARLQLIPAVLDATEQTAEDTEADSVRLGSRSFDAKVSFKTGQLRRLLAVISIGGGQRLLGHRMHQKLQQ